MPVPPNHELSDRELEILRLVATGASNKEIAQQLVISANTVKVHLRNIFAKIGATSRTEAALYAVRAGLVQSIPAQSAPGAPAGAGEIASGQEAIQSFASITVPAGVSPRIGLGRRGRAPPRPRAQAGSEDRRSTRPPELRRSWGSL